MNLHILHHFPTFDANAQTDDKKLEDGKEEEKIVALDDTDIQILKTYVSGM